MEPKQLGPYKIGERIGKGGMGSVYRGTDRDSGQVAAIKVLAPQLAQSEGFRERFEAEIESLKTLRHDGIVRLMGYGKDHGALFYSMELVDGTSLDEEIKAGRRFNWHETVDIAQQVCRALKHAHDHGIIHRDIKPANILIDRAGRVKLADFGIARLFGGSQLTVAGGVLGTADYMSPEQAEGQAVTDKCDQYSLGCVMYALLAGRPPFRARSLPEMLQMQRYAEPEPVTRYAPSTPAPVSAVISQLLSKDPDKRFPNIMVLGRHLEALRMALTKREEEAEAIITPEVDYDSALAVTRADSRPGPIADSDSNFDVSPSIDLQLVSDAHRNDPTQASQSKSDVDSSGELKALADYDSDPGSGHFTTVDTDASATRSTLSSTVQSLTLLMLLLLLLGAAAGGIWWLAQPQGVDSLYHSLELAAASDSLRQVEPQLRDFLIRFDDDPRAEVVREWNRQVQLANRDRQFDLLARRGRDSDDLLPVEKTYLSALRLADDDSHQALEQLRALIVLYADGQFGSEEQNRRTAECLALAHKKAEQLATTVADELELDRDTLDAIMLQIETLVQSDPEAAAQRAAALVALYNDQSWAAEYVEHARRIVDRIETARVP